MERFKPPFLQSVLKKGQYHTLHFPEEAYVDNRLLLENLQAACLNMGVDLMSSKNPAPHLLSTNEVRVNFWDASNATKTLRSKQLLVTAGVWSNSILHQLGWTAPMIPVKGQLGFVPPIHSSNSMVHLGENLYLVPRGKNMILGASTEPRVWDEGYIQEIGEKIIKKSLVYLSKNPGPFLETWTGIRPRTKDRLPLMGSISSNVFLCTGHYKSGISMAPLAAKCMADLMNEEKPSMDLKPFAPLRKKGLKPVEPQGK